MRRSHIYRKFLVMTESVCRGMWPGGDTKRGINVGGRMFTLQRVMFECMCERMFLLMYASVAFLNKLRVLHAKKASKQLRCENFIGKSHQNRKFHPLVLG